MRSFLNLEFHLKSGSKVEVGIKAEAEEIMDRLCRIIESSQIEFNRESILKETDDINSGCATGLNLINNKDDEINDSKRVECPKKEVIEINSSKRENQIDDIKRVECGDKKYFNCNKQDDINSNQEDISSSDIVIPSNHKKKSNY